MRRRLTCVSPAVACVLTTTWGTRTTFLIEDRGKSAAASGVSLDKAVANLVKTVDVAKAETEHQHG
jgi:hypothetical protein